MYRQLIIITALLACLSSVAQKTISHSIPELRSLLQKSIADTGRIRLSFETGLSYVLRPGNTKTDMDSALYFTDMGVQLAQTLKEPAWEARGWYVYSNIFRETEQIDKGKKNIENAISFFTKQELKSDLGDALLELANYYNPYKETESAEKIKYYQQAEMLFEQTGEKQKQGSALKNLADFHQILGKDSLAIEELHKSLAIYQSIGYAEMQGVYDLLGYIYFNKQHYKLALKYGQLALQTAVKVKVSDQELSTINNRIGLTYYQLLQYNEAVKYFKRSYDLALANHDTSSGRVIFHNVVNSYLRLQQPQDAILFLNANKFIPNTSLNWHAVTYNAGYVLAHLLNGQPEKAGPYVHQLHRLVKDEPDAGILRSFHRAIIPYYLATGKYNETYKYFSANETFCRQNYLIPGLADNYLWWFKADSALGKLGDAIAHYKLYKLASDSAQRMANDRQISELLVEYETNKKDQEIAFQQKNIQLLTSQATLQKSQLKQTKLVRNLTISGIVLLLIIIGLLFNRYRLRQRANTKLELKQEEINQKNISLQGMIGEQGKLLEEKEWLLKEVHHRVKNNLQMMVSLLNTQSAYLDNQAAIEAVRDSQHRMEAISLIHKKLYQSDDSSVVNMKVYIGELIQYLQDSFDMSSQVLFEQHIEPVKLDVTHAVPLGLILNEAISNSIKYAFPGNRKGTIRIGLNSSVLTIADNGIGLPEDFDTYKVRSLGISLMKGLCRQLGCHFSITGNNGVTITIELDEKKANPATIIVKSGLATETETTGHA
jgi:two-component system, sensor histidine kinase PdtaS